MSYGYSPTPTYYPNLTYAPVQMPAAGYPPAVPSQQIPNVPTNIPAAASASSNIQWVQGEAAALAYPVAPGNTVILMDSDNPVVYKKSTDEHGKPLPMDIYDLHKRETSVNTTAAPSTPTIDTSMFVKKSEIESFIAERIEKELDKRVSNLSFKPATKKRRTDEDEEE